MAALRDPKTALIEDRVQHYEHNVQSLTKELAARHKVMNELALSQRQFAQALRGMARQEHHEPTQRTLDRMAELFDGLVEDQEMPVIKRMEEEVLDRLRDMQSKCIVPTKKLVADRKKQLNTLQNAEVKLAKLTNPAKPAADAKKTKSHRVLLDEAQRMVHTEETTVQNLIKFEQQRLLDLKGVLMEYTREQLYHHCRSLERLTECAQLLQQLDISDGHDAFAEQLHRFPIPGMSVLEDSSRPAGLGAMLRDGTASAASLGAGSGSAGR